MREPRVPQRPRRLVDADRDATQSTDDLLAAVQGTVSRRDPEERAGDAVEVGGRAGKGHRRVQRNPGGALPGRRLQHVEARAAADVQDSRARTHRLRRRQLGDDPAEGVVGNGEHEQLRGLRDRRGVGNRHPGEQRCCPGARRFGSGGHRRHGEPGAAQRGTERGAGPACADDAYVGMPSTG